MGVRSVLIYGIHEKLLSRLNDEQILVDGSNIGWQSSTIRESEVQYGTVSKALETHLMAKDGLVPSQQSKHERQY